MRTKDVVWVSTLAALYAVFTIALAPISYGPIQLRASEALKVFCLFSPWSSLGIAIGTIFANLASPFVGPWELVWMPITDGLGGLIAFGIFKLLREKITLVWLPVFIYAVTTSVAVSFMLAMLGIDSFWIATGPILIGESIVMLGGIPFILRIRKVMQSRSSRLF